VKVDGQWKDFSWQEFETRRAGNPDLSPYDDRDPRFYATILYNGASWENRVIDTKPGGDDAIGEFALSGTASSSVTGYWLKKFITEGETGWETNGSDHFGITVRYGEVLLNKAEALAELGRLSEALDALNQIRDRVGLPARTASSKDAFMQHLRTERMLELAGEGFRYWDLRRWRLGEDVINGQSCHGCKITENADGSLSYEQVDVDAGQTRVFTENYYAFSCPVGERSNNELFGDNNPGW